MHVLSHEWYLLHIYYFIYVEIIFFLKTFNSFVNAQCHNEKKNVSQRFCYWVDDINAVSQLESVASEMKSLLILWLAVKSRVEQAQAHRATYKRNLHRATYKWSST